MEGVGGGVGGSGGENRDNNRRESTRRKEVMAYSEGDKREMEEKERKTEDKTRLKSRDPHESAPVFWKVDGAKEVQGGFFSFLES